MSHNIKADKVLVTKKVQTSVVIVQPGGTGISKSAISAKFAPFPPSRFFISALGILEQ